MRLSTISTAAMQIIINTNMFNNFCKTLPISECSKKYIANYCEGIISDAKTINKNLFETTEEVAK